MVSGNQKDIRGLVLDFYFKFNIYQYKSDICYNEN
jgi:hypothetical protein